MPNASYVATSVRQQTEVLALTEPVSFLVNCDGWDTLMLQIDYINDDGTALVFSFQDAEGINDADNPYDKAKTDYASGTITFAPSFTGAVTDDVHSTVPFSLTGIGLPGAGNILVTISCTGAGGGSTDTIQVTPICARTA